MAIAPIAADIRGWSSLDFARYDYPDTVTGNRLLQMQVDRAVAYLSFITGRSYVQSQTDVFPSIKTMLDQATQMRTEQVILSLASDQLDTAADIDLISSFSAGSYSETRKDPDGERRALNPWRPLNDLLWMLLSLFPGETNDLVEERFGWWRYVLGLGSPLPAWQTVEVDYARGLGLSDWFGYSHNSFGAIGSLGPLPEWNDSRIG